MYEAECECCGKELVIEVRDGGTIGEFSDCYCYECGFLSSDCEGKCQKEE